MTEKITAITEDIRNNHISLNKDKLLISNEDGSRLDVLREVNVSIFRPIRCSEVLNKLSKRNWNRLGLKYVSNGIVRDYLLPGDINTCDHITGIMYINNPNLTESQNITKIGRPVTRNISENDLLTTNDLYENEFKDMDGTNEVWFYRSTKELVNTVFSNVTKDIIPYGSSTYTDTVNLSDIIHHSATNKLSAKVDLTIQFTKKDRMASIELPGPPKIYTKDISFESFDYSNGELVVNNFVEDLNRDVVVEYINGTVRAIPKNDDVIECIIRKCSVTYGNIK